MIKIIIKTFLILFLFSNVLVKANDISAMGGISDAAGGAAQAAADQLSSDAGKVSQNIAGATEALGQAKSEFNKGLVEGDVTSTTEEDLDRGGMTESVALVEEAKSKGVEVDGKTSEDIKKELEESE